MFFQKSLITNNSFQGSKHEKTTVYHCPNPAIQIYTLAYSWYVFCR